MTLHWQIMQVSKNQKKITSTEEINCEKKYLNLFNPEFIFHNCFSK